VQQALPHVRKALVALQTATGAASGVIVSPEGLVLTAAHVTNEGDGLPKPGRKLKVILATGDVWMSTALGMDLATDAAMLQLDGKRTDWPYVSLKRSTRPKPGEWCFALGHPGGHDRERGDVLRVGKVLKVMPNGLQTDCVLMGGDSGGPLFALDGELIGIHSQIWEGRDQNVHVSITPYLRSWDFMRDGAIIREWGHGAGGWLGVITRSSEAGLEVAEVAAESPAARVGLRAGDRIKSVDGIAVADRPSFANHIHSRPAGDPVVLVVENRSGERILTIRLGHRPKE
jgi:serine protease Do